VHERRVAGVERPVAPLCFERHGRVSYVSRRSLNRALAGVGA